MNELKQYLDTHPNVRVALQARGMATEAAKVAFLQLCCLHKDYLLGRWGYVSVLDGDGTDAVYARLGKDLVSVVAYGLDGQAHHL